jgi:hypothetical protein
MNDAIKSLVSEQAEDEGLWFCAGTCAEAYVQQALRKLHSAIECAEIWQTIDTAPQQEPILVTSEFFPGFFDVAAYVPSVGWRQAKPLAGDPLRHEPTHWAKLRPVQNRKAS